MFRSRRRKQPEADDEEEIIEVPAMISDDLGAPKNATRRTKKKFKKQQGLTARDKRAKLSDD
jgi:hypothetical protein